MICPDCNEKMVKTKIQCEDMSGWMVGWLCDCESRHPDIELTIHAARDWTAGQIAEAMEQEDS